MGMVRRLVAVIYMQVGVTIIGLPDLIDFNIYRKIYPKSWINIKSKYIP